MGYSHSQTIPKVQAICSQSVRVPETSFQRESETLVNESRGLEGFEAEADHQSDSPQSTCS